LQQDELSPQEKAALSGEEQQQKITTYEEAFRRIKEATGVSDTHVSIKLQQYKYNAGISNH
jgi:hypothetical protein